MLPRELKGQMRAAASELEAEGLAPLAAAAVAAYGGGAKVEAPSPQVLPFFPAARRFNTAAPIKINTVRQMSHKKGVCQPHFFHLLEFHCLWHCAIEKQRWPRPLVDVHEPPPGMGSELQRHA